MVRCPVLSCGCPGPAVLPHNPENAPKERPGAHPAKNAVFERAAKAKKGALVSSAAADGGDPPLSIPRKIHNSKNTSDYGTDPDGVSIAKACLGLIEAFMNRPGA